MNSNVYFNRILNSGQKFTLKKMLNTYLNSFKRLKYSWWWFVKDVVLVFWWFGTISSPIFMKNGDQTLFHDLTENCSKMSTIIHTFALAELIFCAHFSLQINTKFRVFTLSSHKFNAEFMFFTLFIFKQGLKISFSVLKFWFNVFKHLLVFFWCYLSLIGVLKQSVFKNL